MTLPITLTIAAAAAVVNLWLAIRISSVRIRKNVLVGDGGDAGMEARTRAHANFVEYAPFVLILVAGIELAGGSPTWLWIAGAVFIVGRIAHGIGMLILKTNPLRAGGILITWVVLAALAGWAVTIAYAGTHAQPARTFALDSATRG